MRGIVAEDAAHAVFTITQVATSAAYPAGRVRFPGLDPARSYALRILSRPAHDPAQSPLAWAEEPVTMTGHELGSIGVRPPVQFPQQATVVEIVSQH